jgi:hypothetical protein
MSEQGVSPEQEVPYERRMLGESGDILVFSGKDIFNTSEKITVLMGSDNAEEAAKSKRYTLHYTDRYVREGGIKRPEWILIDADNQAKWAIDDKNPLALGRDNQKLFYGQNNQERTAVSRKHLAISSAGETLIIFQRSHTNKTFIDAPTTSIVNTDLYSQSGTTK